jgi:hypothetical protein
VREPHQRGFHLLAECKYSLDFYLKCLVQADKPFMFPVVDNAHSHLKISRSSNLCTGKLNG